MAKRSHTETSPGPETLGKANAKTPAQAPTGRVRPWRLRVVAYLAIYALGIVTALAALATLYPWVTISNLQMTDPANPFALRFLMKNEGFWSLRNIRVRCAVFSVTSHGRSQIVENAFEDQRVPGHSLKPRHQTHLDCTPEVADSDTINRAALSISASFERVYLPWAWRREEPPFVYVLERGRDKRAVWLPEG